MGRKKKKKNVTSTPESKGPKSLVEDEDTNDVLLTSLVDLLECTGVVDSSSEVPTESSNHRQDFLDCFHQFRQMDQLFVSEEGNGKRQPHDDDIELLPRLEQCCFDLRSMLQQYRTYLQNIEQKRIYTAWTQIQKSIMLSAPAKDVDGDDDDKCNVGSFTEKRQQWLLRLHSLVQDYKWMVLAPELKRLQLLENQLDQLYNEEATAFKATFETLSFPDTDTVRWSLRDKYKTTFVRILQQILKDDEEEQKKKPFTSAEQATTGGADDIGDDGTTPIETTTQTGLSMTTTTLGVTSVETAVAGSAPSVSIHEGQQQRVVDIRPQLSTMEKLVRDIRHDLSMATRCHSSSSITILVTGGIGSGKTHLLKLLQDSYTSPPREQQQPQQQQSALLIPAEELLLGSKVGESETRILSAVRHCISNNKILLVDNVDKLIGKGRMEATFLSCAFGDDQQINSAGSTKKFQLRMVCTTSTRGCNETWGYRFQNSATYDLGLPTAHDRKLILEEAFGNDGMSMVQEQDTTAVAAETKTSATTTLEDVVACTEGMTRAELLQACRNMILIHTQQQRLQNSPNQQQRELLQQFKTFLQQRKPPSLQLVTDFCDLTIWTGQDLKSRHSPTGVAPLVGVDSAINEGTRHLVTPLCQSQELDHILFGGTEHNQARQRPQQSVGGITSGILISGPSGCGKTTLAFHLAAKAVELLPSVQLLQVSCTSLIHSQVGASERAIHRLFETIKQLQSSIPCILLLEDVDMVTQVRGYDTTTEGTMDRVVSTVLTELDGINPTGSSSSSRHYPMAIIGTTRNSHRIDPAVKRPGRLARVVEMPAFPRHSQTT